MATERDLDIIFASPIDWEAFRGRTVLVTAASGRLGAYFVEALAKADLDWNLGMTIVALARSEEKLQRALGVTLELPNVRMILADVTAPIAWEGAVDYIIHTAGLASPKDFTERPVDTLWGHVMGTRNVLELARHKGTRRVFYVSTVEIYGDWHKEADLVEEDMGPMRCDRSRACYPEAKRLCETMLAAYATQYGVDYAGVRMSHTFGPGISLADGRAFAEFMQCALSGRDIVLHSDGSAVRTYTYVADAVGAMLLVLTKGAPQTFYNVANRENACSILEVAEMIAALAPSGKVQVRREGNATGGLQYLPFKLGVMNTDRIGALGWRARVDARHAFQYTMESFEQQDLAR